VLPSAGQTPTALLSITMVQTISRMATVTSIVQAELRALCQTGEIVMRALAPILLPLQHLHLQANQIGQLSSLDPLATATTVIKPMHAMLTRL
jgi:hypothetical protein